MYLPCVMLLHRSTMTRAVAPFHTLVPGPSASFCHGRGRSGCKTSRLPLKAKGTEYSPFTARATQVYCYGKLELNRDCVYVRVSSSFCS